MVFKRQGQSLIEIMIGVAVSVILITSAATLISVTLKSSTQNKFIQAASFLSQDLIDKVTIFAEKQWNCASGASCGIYNLNKGSSNHYRLITSGGAFVSAPNDETVTLDGVDYTRYFYAENVNRVNCGVGDITPNAISAPACSTPGGFGIAEDPSTQKLTVVTSWTYSGTTSDIRIVKYVTRSRNQVFLQTDWSGGPDPAAAPLTVPNNKFYSSSNINFIGIPGSIKLQ